MDNIDNINLNEYTKDEWREVIRMVRPDVSDEQFDKDWEEFCELKRKKKLQ